MVKKSIGQTYLEGSGGGLLPAVEGHSLGTRYKEHSDNNKNRSTLEWK